MDYRTAKRFVHQNAGMRPGSDLVVQSLHNLQQHSIACLCELTFLIIFANLQIFFVKFYKIEVPILELEPI